MIKQHSMESTFCPAGISVHVDHTNIPVTHNIQHTFIYMYIPLLYTLDNDKPLYLYCFVSSIQGNENACTCAVFILALVPSTHVDIHVPLPSTS